MIDTIRSPEWSSSDIATSLAVMVALLRTLILSFPENTTFTIIIDRLDQCDLPGDFQDQCNDLIIDLKHFRDLIRDASLTRYCIKFLFVMDETPARTITRRLSAIRGHNVDGITDWRQGDEFNMCHTESDAVAGAVEEWDAQHEDQILLTKSVGRLSI